MARSFDPKDLAPEPQHIIEASYILPSAPVQSRDNTPGNIFLPQHWRKTILTMAHSSKFAGHPGVHKKPQPNISSILVTTFGSKGQGLCCSLPRLCPKQAILPNTCMLFAPFASSRLFMDPYFDGLYTDLPCSLVSQSSGTLCPIIWASFCHMSVFPVSPAHLHGLPKYIVSARWVQFFSWI